MTDLVTQALARGVPPIVAILRGLPPGDAEAIGGALVEAGIGLIEVPLNSPEPFVSIACLVERFGDAALIGAGTVLTIDDVARVTDIGGRIIVAPNVDRAVIAAALAAGAVPMPGFVTPTEAFTAVAAGARHLKLFPAATLGPAHLRAVGEVLPRGVALWAVGGTDPQTLGGWLDGGATGIGVGGALYRPGFSVHEVGDRARALVTAWRDVLPAST